MSLKDRIICLSSIFIIFNLSSLLIAQNAEITIDGGGASITITANGENKSYLIHDGSGEGEIIVNSGAFLTTWTPEALINFIVSGDGDISLPVELSSFSATQNDGVVILEWITESEINNLGFNLYRSKDQNDDYICITPELISGAGTTSERQIYNFTDNNVLNGDTYWYNLEEVSFDGIKKTYKTISITLGNLNTDTPNEYSLNQNFPNPFNPQTTIVFDLPEKGFVVINILDLQGRLIKRLSNCFYEAGNHHISWNGKNEKGDKVASGVYIYTIKAGKFTESKKMLKIQ